MTHREMGELVGHEAAIQSESLVVRVKILDAKAAYGDTRILVSPVAGAGEAWVSLQRLVSRY